MPIVAMPPEFDLNYYRRAYPELNNMSDAVLNEHYKRYAAEQGHSACIYDRSEYLQKILQDVINKRRLKTLEISPWDNPFLRGDSVKYFATADAETLRKTAAAASRPFNSVPAKIDFVSPMGDLSVVDEKFIIVFSSHVIEHCPDLVEHLNQVSRILNPGGVYVMLVPDKRYCFDHYNSESTIAEVIDTAISKRKIPRLANVIKTFTRTHNDAILHWLGEHGKPLADNSKDDKREKLLRSIEKYQESFERGEYIDTHNWQFTPDNFRYIVDMLNDLKFIDLRLYRCCNTVWGRFEFVAVLEKI